MIEQERINEFEQPDFFIPIDRETTAPSAPSYDFDSNNLPLQGDIVVTRDSTPKFLYVDKAINYEGGLILEANASMVNYHPEEGGPKFQGRSSRNTSFDWIKRPTAEQLATLASAMAAKDMTYDTGRKAFVHELKRTINSSYWYITDKYDCVSVLDDGTSVHAQRFNSRNYFQEGKQTIAQKLIDVIKWQTTEVRIVK